MTKMKKLFYFLFAFALINISTQFVEDLESLDNESNPIPTANPVVKECGAKIYNKTYTRECLDESTKHWYPNVTWDSIDPITERLPLTHSNRTECCFNWENIKCYLICQEKVCTQEEVKESNAYLDEAIKFFDADECRHYPYHKYVPLCRPRESMPKKECY
jgi:hypothetical protein